MEVLADYSPTARFDPSTETSLDEDSEELRRKMKKSSGPFQNSLDEDSEELRRAMKKATQHKEMGPEYLHSRNVKTLA